MIKRYHLLYLALPALLLMGCNSNTTTTEEAATDTIEEVTTGSAAVLMTHATLTVPETNTVVSISKETGRTVEYEDGEEHGTVTIVDEYVESIGDSEYVTFIAVNYGGSGVETYLAGFQFEEASNQMTDSIFLGDRIDLKSLTVSGSKVTVTYMEHGDDQAMAEVPNVKVVKTYTFINGRLTEIDK